MKRNPCGMTKEYKGFRIIYLQKYNLYEIFDGKKYLAAKPTFQMTKDFIDELVGTSVKNPKSRKFDGASASNDFEDDEDLAEWEYPGFGTPIYSKKRKMNPVITKKLSKLAIGDIIYYRDGYLYMIIGGSKKTRWFVQSMVDKSQYDVFHKELVASKHLIDYIDKG